MKCINLFLRDGSTLPSSGDAAFGWPVDAAKAVYSMNYVNGLTTTLKTSCLP